MSGGPGARRRLGAEVAKDLVLSGVRSLTVWDGAAALVTWEDVATDCLLTPEVCPRTPSPAPLIKKQHQQQQFPPTQGDKPRTSCPQPPPPNLALTTEPPTSLHAFARWAPPPPQPHLNAIDRPSR